MNAETLDKLYLEYSDLTTARNAREEAARQIAKAIIDEAVNLHDIDTSSRRKILNHAIAIQECLK